MQDPRLLLTDVKDTSFDVGIISDQNKEHMVKMENTHAAFVPYMGDSKLGFFGVYDGHGGHEVADLVSRSRCLDLPDLYHQCEIISNR